MTSPAPQREITIDRLAVARSVLRAEAESLHLVAERINSSFERVVDRLFRCRGRVAISGVGKSADVGQKIVGTFNSTGTRAYLLDATRAAHGDLGMVHPDDVVLLLSHSGESEELLRLLPSLARLSAGLVALTGNPTGTLARRLEDVIVYGPVAEACPLALAPSTSTTVMIALGDALAFTLLEMREFTAEQFALFHPAGSLGRKLATVEQAMRRGQELRIAPDTETVQVAFSSAKRPGRRTGALMLIDAEGRLTGLFTDSDLARLLERKAYEALERPISEVMTRDPLRIGLNSRISEALELVKAKKISELPVVDDWGRPVGLLDITDLIGIDPENSDSNSTPILRLFQRPASMIDGEHP
jgi:arabinose-5-phosphate isomerase